MQEHPAGEAVPECRIIHNNLFNWTSFLRAPLRRFSPPKMVGARNPGRHAGKTGAPVTPLASGRWQAVPRIGSGVPLFPYGPRKSLIMFIHRIPETGWPSPAGAQIDIHFPPFCRQEERRAANGESIRLILCGEYVLHAKITGHHPKKRSRLYFLVS